MKFKRMACSMLLLAVLAAMMMTCSVSSSIRAQSYDDDSQSESDKAEKGDAAFWVFMKIFGPIILGIGIFGAIATKAMSSYGKSKYLDHHYIHEAMSKEFFYTEEEKTLLETHWVFERKKVEDLLVVRDPMIFCGMVYRADVDSLDPTTLADKRVTDILKPVPATLNPHDAISKAVELFGKLKCAYIPVVESGRLVGVVTLSAIEKIVKEKAPGQ